MSKKKNRFDHTYDEAKRFHGCDQNYFNIPIDNNFLKLLRSIQIKQSERTISKPKKITGIKLGSDFLKFHFKLHNIDILPKYNVNDLIAYFSTLEKDDIKAIYNSLLVQVNPLDLKYEFIETLNNFTNVVYPVVGERPYFDKILFSNEIENTKLSETTYIHEIIHTQVESVLNSYKNIYNSEVLPYLCELIYTYEKALVDDGELLKYTLKNMFDVVVLKANRVYDSNRYKFTYDVDRNYCSSILKAFCLFEIFQSFKSDDDRNLMIDNIQRVFDGNMTVEQLLNIYNINDNNLLNDNVIKMLKK